MLEVEEGGPGDTGTPADANSLSGPGQLTPAADLRLSRGGRSVTLVLVVERA